MNDPTLLDALALSAAIRQREISCRELMRATLERIDRVNPGVNAIVSLRQPEALLAQADERDAQLARGEWLGWMHGMPQAPKDLTNAAGLPTSVGSPIFRDFVAPADSIIVERARRAGAIVIGKTNTPEFGLGSQTYNAVFGATRNAYDRTLCAGGSSGGAAVAVALRMLPVADGSDMGGSLRNPAAYANIFGFRPSQGRVPSDPAPDLYFQQLGIAGPMARTVRELVALLAVQAGYDARAPLSLDGELAISDADLDGDVAGTRIAWLGDLGGYLPFEPGVLGLCREALRAFEPLGCEVSAADAGFDPTRLWSTWLALRSLTQGGALHVHYADPARRPLLKPEAVWEVENGLRASGLDIHRAAVARSDWYRAVLALFKRFDVLALPSAQVFAFDVDTHWPRAVGGRPMDTYHRWMEVVVPGTLSGCPVISVPAGFDAAGRPMGVQLIGRPRGDAALLRVAQAYDRATQWASRRPPPTR